jgi:phage baseplate assembly protein W
MPSEILIPFALDVNGGVAQTTDPDVQQEQHVSSLIGTNPGERVMRPTYGIPTDSYLFTGNTANIATMITKDVKQAMATFEPGITVNSVTPVWNNQLGVADIDVDYLAAPEDTGAIQSATISVGGTVTVQ